MALQKQNVTINFAKGLDTKTDPKQVELGKFLTLENTVFKSGVGLQKRFGFATSSTLPVTTNTTVTTLADNLVATGANLYSYSDDLGTWASQGTVQPVDVNILPVVRNSKSQTAPDMTVAPNGLACTVWVEAGSAFYQISDASNGTVLVAQTALPATAANPRVFVLGAYFLLMFGATVAATPHLQYKAIPYAAPTSPGSATDFATTISAITAGWDAVVYNNSIYVVWQNNATGVNVGYMSSTLALSSQTVIATKRATLASATADSVNNRIWFSFWDTATGDAYSTCYDLTLAIITAATKTISAVVLTQITSTATSGTMTLLYQVTNTYSWSGSTDIVRSRTMTEAAVLGTAADLIRSVGLASKAFLIGATGYVLVVYATSLQPTYFLVNYSGKVLAKVAYSNGGLYYSSIVLPSVHVDDTEATVAYLFKDLLLSANKSSATGANVYTQVGINKATFGINSLQQQSSEIAGSLHLTGGQLWHYDGTTPVEHGFHVYPENVNVTTATGAGLITADTYQYMAVYEWTDAAGNLHRSAPSIPATVTTTTATSTNTIKVPTLRLTSKTNVRIVLYRWSVTNPLFYQATSVSSPTANVTTADSVTIVDALADSSIIGNNLIYTTGGVIENIGAPACFASCLSKSRLFIVDAEDRNLIWYSKQVLQATPVELSDLLTIYVAPTTGAQGSTGPITALGAMDDKLIVFKQNAIYYVTGTGPDATGANNDFSEPTFITSVAGCSNRNSIVFMPAGIMFQSDKGIWLLGRDLSTKYVGAPVEAYNDVNANSAVNVPGTNEVRFTLDSGITLMYDYYYDQWGTFTSGAGGISSTIWQGAHTVLNSLSQIRQQSDAYLDGTRPVLMKFTTAWAKLAGLQGYQRAYHMFLLSNYITPHKLNVQLAYDYVDSPTQTTIIEPTNFNDTYGSDTLYGGSTPYGGQSPLEQWRVFFTRQKCQSIRVTMTEVYDGSFGVAAGAGLAMSGISLIIGGKKNYPAIAAASSKT